MNRTSHARTLLGLSLVAIFLSGSPAWGQLSRLFTIRDRIVSFDTTCAVSECREVLFINIGNRPITINEIEVPSVPFAFDPSAPISVPLTLSQKDTLHVRFCYLPTAPEAVDAERIVLTIDTGSATDLAHDTLWFNGVSRSPQVEIDPPTIDFGDLTIGGFQCVTVEIRNNGNEPIDLSLLDPLGLPFAPDAIPSRILSPGEGAQVQICFSPLAIQDYLDTMIVGNGNCREPATLIVKGRGLKPLTNVGPVLRVVSVDFDSTLCGTTKCGTVTLRNVGTDPMQVMQLDPVLPPFSGSIAPSPVDIPAYEERTVTFCYAPQSVPSVDSATIDIMADNRVPLSIAAVFDISGSMKLPFGPAQRIDAANAAGQLFIGNLVNEPGLGIVDEGAVYVFGDVSDFLRVEDYTTNLALLQNAVPSVTSANATCIYNAVIRVNAELGTRNIPGRRVMVLLTDGENLCDNSSESLNDAIAAAQAGGIRIYTIGIGSVNKGDLTQLALETGGFFSEALTPADLIDSYERIANDLSKSQPSFFTMKGRSVAPDLEVSVSSLQFDSVRVGNNRCRTFTLRNTGDAVLPITSFVRPSVHFTVTPSIIPDIPPGDSVEVEVCFRPGLLRGIDSIITFGYTHCTPQSKSVTLSGTGYDSVVIEMNGSYIARPGSVITIPVRLVGRIPSTYVVDSLTLVFGYNKTVLFPEVPSTPLSLENTPTAAMTRQDAEPAYDPENATLTIDLSGGRMHSLRPDTLLAELSLLALHGNSLTTPVELKDARFADGNPKVGIRSSVNFLADSLCFQEERLVDASARFGSTLKLVSMKGRQAVIRIALRAGGRARSDLFDALGRHVGVVFDEETAAGDYETALDLSDLPAGSYWLRFLLNDDEQAVMNVIVRN